MKPINLGGCGWFIIKFKVSESFIPQILQPLIICINDLKVLLANKSTALLHGENEAKNSEQAAKEAFSGNLLGSTLPKVNVKLQKIQDKINLIDLVLISKLENSKSEIRRLIKGNAVKINDNVVSDEKYIISQNLFKENYIKLSLGKKRHIKIELD